MVNLCQLNRLFCVINRRYFSSLNISCRQKTSLGHCEFSFLEDEFIICDKKYRKDEWTNLTPKIVSLIGRNLLNDSGNGNHFIAQLTRKHFADFLLIEFPSPVVNLEENFDSLLIKKDHVSRRNSESYYLTKDFLLRTHTSAHQIECLKRGNTTFILMADVFRRDHVNATHYPAFHQCEGFKTFSQDKVSYNILSLKCESRTKDRQEIYTIDATKAVELDMKTTLEGYVRFLFGEPVEYRWVDAYFPFTHPSWELEIFTNGDWMEVLGCGVVESAILENANIPRDSIAWAVGFGMERLAMIKYKIPDIRVLWSNDTGITRQFSRRHWSEEFAYKPISQFPQTSFDLSFFIPHSKEKWSENDFYDLVRNTCGDLIEQVEIIDDFTNPKGNWSQTYRLVYRSNEKKLTREEVHALHNKVCEEVVSRYGVNIR